jgi:hypothetical protein
VYEWKQHKTWLDDKRSQFLSQTKGAKMQWLQGTNQRDTDNRNNVRPEASRHFRNKKREYLKAKINELVADSKIKNQRLVKDHHGL